MTSGEVRNILHATTLDLGILQVEINAMDMAVCKLMKPLMLFQTGGDTNPPQKVTGLVVTKF